MKRLIIALVLVIFAAGSLALIRGQAETFSKPEIQATLTSETRTIQVTGTGEVQVQPDSAVVNLGVQTDADTAQAALTQNNTKMQNLVDILKKANIPSKDIQTQTLRLSPRYENSANNNKLVGYTATNTVQVHISDLDRLGTLLDDAVGNGANTIENISFNVSNPEKVSDQARQNAFQNARHKAEQLADLSNATLGPILEIQESSNIPGPIAQPLESVAQPVAVPISPGSQTVTVNLQVTWSLATGNQQ